MLHERLDEILRLAGHIRDLGAEPTTRLPPPHIGNDAPGAITEDLALERILMTRYRLRLDQARKLRLAQTSDMVSRRMESLDDAIRYLEHAIANLLTPGRA